MANLAVSRTEGSGMRMRMFSINNYREEGRKREKGHSQMDDNQVSIGNENGYDYNIKEKKELRYECWSHTWKEAVYYLKLITYSKDLGGVIQVVEDLCCLGSLPILSLRFPIESISRCEEWNFFS